ncbi:adenosine deaminase [Cordyceps fumosorosea ARSEF 2679]|uniref:adenosine deaminase n=1 Tax=Cordyceps fumosorosea (strain ARSEF 2679) TaxID=1081104 RepID=A0A168AR28_CORFA|nr:adenosine deaminase [Cordyceps fumosorosea ARSEF 2679]OAA69081.1 adenosine deaminase [Cordyceps fumosorosea ARSEF 2679]
MTSDTTLQLQHQLRQDSAQDAEAALAILEATHSSSPPRAPLKRQRSSRSATATTAARDHGQPSAELDVDAYLQARRQLYEAETSIAFDYRCRARATPLEQAVDGILHRLRRLDRECVYDAAEPRCGHGGQRHPRFPGDHFLGNLDLIENTRLLDVAHRLPKGAHLHIHFNACLPPAVLLGIAKGMDRMFITSDLPLVKDNGRENYSKCEIQFSLLSVDKEDDAPGNLFSAGYKPRQTMKFAAFLELFSQHYPGVDAEEWLVNKLVFSEKEAHGVLQTAAGAWEKFNGRTRMMKGLFNYETAYRKYTRLCLEDFLRDNIQYAEIRPNFMRSNQLYHDDGTGPIDNQGIMNIIIDEVTEFQREITAQGRYFGGIKVIYCTPRSLDRAGVKAALDECLEFKQRWPKWIAGFDLVGEEARGRPLSEFVPELLAFQAQCRQLAIDIPFLFHCGETLDTGSSTDGNLLDALLLGARRIGHGFALPKHPLVLQRMRARGVCVELCPISNEILGLTPRVNGHAMYALLANNVHCAVSSDNGALFRSSLSHDFYQVMIGKADMGLYGWKQLALWSIEHACLDDDERAAVLQQWERMWDEFLQWVVETYAPSRASKTYF